MKDYILKWNSNDKKPVNEVQFVDSFIEYLSDIDDIRCVEFDGAGAYSGKQITINPNIHMGMTEPELEVAYGKKRITVYSTRHNGFWIPPYIELQPSDPQFEKVTTALNQFINNVFGINNFGI